ncbi:MAG: AI-2E family transporter [Gammaproteobacteria bacterium TMED119]|nr:MAG: AI-2E family transporter [Gammaproteobacteria bacterium TMED119]|tara:strand:+ start:1325 stop:2401 length:1077 start_codon:yes stop_codon:yes gene_type:complete
MLNYLKNWYLSHFSNPQVVTLTLFILTGFMVIVFSGKILAPLFASIVIAYLLDGAVDMLERTRAPRILALSLVFVLFVATIVVLLFVLVPLLSEQFRQFFSELPSMVNQGQQLLMRLPEYFPQLVNAEQVSEISSFIRGEILAFGQSLLAKPLASVVGLITILIYSVIVPLLVFFLLKDKKQILNWIEHFLPAERELTNEVWFEVNQKIASYVRGKFLEVFIVTVATYIAFAVLDLNYAMLLAVLVGLSVIIPYAGAAVVTLPVMFVAYAQWGIASEFFYVLAAYTVIQFLDGNVLVPLLFSEVVNLHPVAIIVAVLFFGGLWGLWGVFFAIPLATLINAVINLWPAADEGSNPSVSL